MIKFEWHDVRTPLFVCLWIVFILAVELRKLFHFCDPWGLTTNFLSVPFENSRLKNAGFGDVDCCGILCRYNAGLVSPS